MFEFHSNGYKYHNDAGIIICVFLFLIFYDKHNFIRIFFRYLFIFENVFGITKTI